MNQISKFKYSKKINIFTIHETSQYSKKFHIAKHIINETPRYIFNLK